ncbi:MAG: HD-GYP domain-containing protein [Oscillospiraceae bacterium]|nr:HD-GYP domain-containing protein [Oscillospiraceae bacterium]
MLIVPVDKLREGMQLADDVSSTDATKLEVIFQKGIFLSSVMIDMLKEKGIKQVKIEGGGKISDDYKNASTAVGYEKPKISENISRALSDLNDIFECNEEIKELSKTAVEKVDNIADSIVADFAENSDFLANHMIALQNYDDYTYKHCLRVAMMAASVCAELKLPQEAVKETVVSGLLHDIGKSNIDHDIIIKPGKLTDAEFAEIKKHPLIGYNILKASGDYSDNILNGVLFHQEKFDGTGYPMRIAGEEIPLIARILTVCDVFDALTSNRPYRVPWSVPETEEYMLGGSGTHFDLNVTKAFLRAFNPYPIGTMVELSDRRHGVVLKHNDNVLRPVVRIMGSSEEIIDLMNDFKYLSITVKGLYTGEVDI